MFTSLPQTLLAQQVLPLYPDGIPNARPTTDKELSSINSDSILVISNISRPTPFIYHRKKKAQAPV
jgi:hypothetical protein